MFKVPAWFAIPQYPICVLVTSSWKPSFAGYQSVLTQTVGPAAMDVEAYCSIKDQLGVPVPQHWRFKPTRNLGVDVDLTSEMGCDPPKTAMSLTGWWFGTWLDYFHSWDDDSIWRTPSFFKTIKPTKQFMICWVRSPAKSGGLWSGDCGRSQCLQHSESRGPGVRVVVAMVFVMGVSGFNW